MTIFWNEVTVRWNEVTWNEVTMERSDRIPTCTPTANVAEIVILALDSSATAAIVAEAQGPSLGWRNIHSHHRLMETY